MIGRIATAYQIELIKAFRSKLSYVGPILAILLVLMTPLLHPLRGDGENAYRFIAFATPTALNVLGLFLVLSFCASLISGETGTGSIRLVFTRPILRHEFVIAKLLIGFTYAITVSLLVAITAWAIAFAFGSASGVEFGGEMLFTSGAMLRAYLLGFALHLAPQFAFVSYAVMISSFMKSNAASVITSIGIWLLLDAVKYPLGISPMLFATYVDTPWEIFRAQADGLTLEWGDKVYWCLGTSLVAATIFSIAAIVTIHRRNFHG
ncbi:MAG: ABC transporter permease [Candidatus Hydrogenedentes bacterium]|nr:ABC transporter permease [Candidatus Hydrogenedentota bacterium]